MFPHYAEKKRILLFNTDHKHTAVNNFNIFLQIGLAAPAIWIENNGLICRHLVFLVLPDTFLALCEYSRK